MHVVGAPWVRVGLRTALAFAGTAVILGSALAFRAADWPVYVAFTVLSVVLFPPFVSVLPRMGLPLPALANVIGFLYIGGPPIIVLAGATSLITRFLMIAWSRTKQTAGTQPDARAGAQARTFFRQMMMARSGAPLDALGEWAVLPIGLAARWWIASALAPEGPPVTDAVAIAAAELGSYTCWALLAALPIYPDGPLFPYAKRPSRGRAGKDPAAYEAYRRAVSDIGLIIVLAVTPFVFLIVSGFRTYGLGGAVVWSLFSLGLHLMLKRLNERRLTVEAQNQQLEALNRELQQRERLSAIGKMSSVISHQTLHELGVIGIYADLIRNTSAGAEAGAAVEQLKRHGVAIEEALTKVNGTLKDLLVFSKDLRLNLYEHPVHRVVEESVEGCRAAASERGVRLNCDCSANATIRLDKLKLTQAIGNVLRNAIEASPPGAEVQVRASLQNDGAEITIGDGGPGVPERDREAIFTPFFTTKEHGTGLGLAIAREFVEAHGGTLTVETCTPGWGARFVLRLPLTER